MLRYDRGPEVVLTISPQVIVRDIPRKVRSSLASAETYGPYLEERRTYTVRATGYNSLAAQTDSTPFITATGATTGVGIIAVSRDLLAEDIPYGSLVRLRDLGTYYSGRGLGKHQDFLDAQDLFIVEDTLHQRKENQIDVWFPQLSQARDWGVRQVELELVRYGRDGQRFDVVKNELPEGLELRPQFTARPQGQPAQLPVPEPTFVASAPANFNTSR
jgi:3D (Asp-Asp-Asp) domain-containing protein